MIVTKFCRDCRSLDLVPRGAGFRNRCHACWNKYQRDRWAGKRDQCRTVSRANYQKHSVRRREESAATKMANREYYTLAEWFRRKGISVANIPEGDMESLIQMKKALRQAKAAVSTPAAGTPA